MRVRPTVWIGFAVVAMYLAIVVVIQKSSGIAYTDFGDSSANLWRAPVLSAAVGSVALVILTTWLGWWRPALRERRRTKARWTIIAPLFTAIAVAGNVATTTWSALSLEFVVGAVALGVFVGFAEELATRGALLVGLRSSTAEVWVALVTALCFGLIHGANIFLGQSVADTVPQIVQAGLQGLAFYILRRVTGTLIWAMVLHGSWDFSLFVQDAAGNDGAWGGLNLVAIVLAPIFFWFAARDAREGTGRRESALAEAPA